MLMMFGCVSSSTTMHIADSSEIVCYIMLHVDVIHPDWWLRLLLVWWVRPLTHHALCAPVSEWYGSCLMFLMLSCIRGPTLTFQSVNSSRFWLSSSGSALVLLADCWHSQYVPLFIRGLTSAHRHKSCVLTNGTDAVQCPYLKIRQVSSKQTHMSVHCSLFTCNLIVVASRVFRMCVCYSHPGQRCCKLVQPFSWT